VEPVEQFARVHVERSGEPHQCGEPDLLDVRVTVTRGLECEACGGRGKVKGGTGGLSCPVC
jgi:hypothetical protein